MADCCACRCLSNRWCSAISSVRIASSSKTWRDMNLDVPKRVIGFLGSGAPRQRVWVRGLQVLRLLAIRGAAFDLTHDSPHELLARGPRHPIDQLLIRERRKGLAAAAAVQQVRFEGALVHLLEQRSKESLRDPFLCLLRERFMRILRR